MTDPKYDIRCTVCGERIYQGVLCAKCWATKETKPLSVKEMTAPTETNKEDKQCSE